MFSRFFKRRKHFKVIKKLIETRQCHKELDTMREMADDYGKRYSDEKGALTLVAHIMDRRVMVDELERLRKMIDTERNRT